MTFKSHLWEMNELRRKLEQNDNKPAPLNMWHFIQETPKWMQGTGFYIQFRKNKKPVLQYYYQAVAGGDDGHVMGQWKNLQDYKSRVTMCNMSTSSGSDPLITRIHGGSTFYVKSPVGSGHGMLTNSMGTNGRIGMIFADKRAENWMIYVLMQPVNHFNGNNRDTIELVGLNLDYPDEPTVQPPSRN